MENLPILSSEERVHATRKVGALVRLEDNTDKLWRVGPPALGVEDADFIAISTTDPLDRVPRRAEDIRHFVRDSELGFSGRYDAKLMAANAIESAASQLDEIDVDPATFNDAQRLLLECVYQLRRYVPVNRYTQGEKGKNSHKV